MVTLTVATTAAAESMDPALERLAVNGSACRDAGGASSGVDCVPDDVAFKRLMSQWSFAFAPSAMHSARTTGFGGFHLSIEGQYTGIRSSADYWKNGTRGSSDAASGQPSASNQNPASVLQLYSVKFRKSFGFGLEATGAFGFMPKTRLMSGGLDLRVSLLEGFRPRDIPGYFPDIAVGGGVRTVTGTPEFQLTVGSLDLQISKPFALASSSQLTPWIGYQYLWTFADSGSVDLTPGTNATNECGYAGTNVPGNPDPQKPGIYDGQAICGSQGNRADLNNNTVFRRARLERQRLLLGATYRYEVLMVGAQVITDLLSPSDAQVGSGTTTTYDSAGQSRKITDREILKDQPRQWTLVFEVGAMF